MLSATIGYLQSTAQTSERCSVQLPNSSLPCRPDERRDAAGDAAEEGAGNAGRVAAGRGLLRQRGGRHDPPEGHHHRPGGLAVREGHLSAGRGGAREVSGVKT